MNKTRRYLLICIIIVTLFGVVILLITRSNGIVNNQNAADFVVQHWLNNTLCSSPCWEGIKPGMSAPEAFAMLQKNKYATNLNSYHDSKLNMGEIDLDWVDDSVSSRIFYKGNSFEDGRIYVIRVGFSRCIRLEEVISAFGFPDHAYTKKKLLSDHVNLPTEVVDQEFFDYTLAWIEKGFSVMGYPSEGTHINEGFLIFDVTFFEPSMEGFLAHEGNSGKRILPWHGFDDAGGYLPP